MTVGIMSATVGITNATVGITNLAISICPLVSGVDRINARLQSEGCIEWDREYIDPFCLCYRNSDQHTDNTTVLTHSSMMSTYRAHGLSYRKD